MAKEPNDGGPAFPIPQQQFTDGYTIVGAEGAPGMTLRDWFAGQVATSIAQTIITADQTVLSVVADAEGYDGSVDGYVAFRSYRIADAMLAEREKANG